MTKNFLCCIIFFTTLSAFSQEQERKYRRKSITILGNILVPKEQKSEVPLDVIRNRFQSRVRMPRFDYNILSTASLQTFTEQVTHKSLTINGIIEKLNETLLPELTTILNTASKERAEKNLKEEDVSTAVVDKMKSSAITSEDILKVMSSAYFSLPVVTGYNEVIAKGIPPAEIANAMVGSLLSAATGKKSTKEEPKKVDMATVNIVGYVLWFRVNYTKAGVSIQYIPEISTMQEGSATFEVAKPYQIKNRSVDGALFSQLIAVNTWMNNIVNEMKKYPDFQLVMEITETKENLAYAKSEPLLGIKLDDGFDVIEEEATTKEGETKKQWHSFLRASQFTSSATEFYQYLGKPLERGMLMYERPRLPIGLFVKGMAHQISFNLASFTNTNVFNTTFPSLSTMPIFAGVNFGFETNMAALFNWSQFFFFLDAEGGASVNLSTPMIGGSAYAGFKKKLWIGLFDFYLEAAGGIDLIGFSKDKNNSYAGLLYGFKFGAGLEFMITPDVLISINGGYKVNISSVYDITIENGTTTTNKYTGKKPVSFDGFYGAVTFSFALEKLGIDPFPGFSAMDIVY